MSFWKQGKSASVFCQQENLKKVEADSSIFHENLVKKAQVWLKVILTGRACHVQFHTHIHSLKMDSCLFLKAYFSVVHFSCLSIFLFFFYHVLSTKEIPLRHCIYYYYKNRSKLCTYNLCNAWCEYPSFGSYVSCLGVTSWFYGRWEWSGLLFKANWGIH